MLDQGRTGLDPIAAVVIGDIAEFMDGGAVDVSTKNAVHPIPFRVFDHCRLELPDKANRIFDPLFDVGAEGPVTKAEASTEEIDRRIEREKELVSGIAEESKPLHILHY